ncbi:MAG TPA: EAL domain-containing protein [Acidimicrobiales bacterium]|nr:EAL domain-containing protein [Acidimicrobiales bacterium]
MALDLPQPETIAGRFLRTKRLKTGYGVQTYAGLDLKLGTPVVIKTVVANEVSESVRLRLEHEALVLGRLETLTYRPLVAVGEDGDLLYLVQPFVPGITLRDRLMKGPLSVDSALRVGIDVLTSLQQAHDGDVLHRDVKPANVIVDEGEPVGRAILIDFGFARSAWLAAEVRDEPVGTARYLAPEATGSLGAAVDERTDLYATGVLLFECLAGRPPFDGNDVGEVLRQHLNEPAPPLRALGIEVPRALDGVIQRLLRKHPDERYQTAGAVFADLNQIADARAEGTSDPTLVIGLHDHRRVLSEPAFVGRKKELTRLTRLVDQARAGLGRLVLLEAESGVGKSRLLDELAQQAEPRSLILRGQGVDQAAQQPFQMLEGVASGLLQMASNDPDNIASLVDHLGPRAGAVGAALPALRPLLASAETDDLGPEAYGELRSVDALSALLDSLGSEERPALVLLDDCQWADGLTVRLLAQWHQQARAEGSNVLVIAAFRSEEVGIKHPLRAIPHTATIVLPPFGVADVRSLAESMAGPLPDEATDVVAHLSEGNPFMASAVLRGLVESSVLLATSDGWEVDPAGLAHAQTSRRAALFLVRRLELLSAPTLRLLSVGAVLGKEFDVALAIELAGLTDELDELALDEAARRKIVWMEDGSRCAFAHDKLREALLTRLDDDETRRLHLRAATTIETIDSARVFELAYHFDAAGQAHLALGYALQAARLARAQHSLDVAEAHYRIAEGASEDADEQTKASVAEGLGDVLTLQGRYGEAMVYLEQARLPGADEVRQATLESKLGDVAFKRGDQRRARRHLEDALRLLGRRVPQRVAGYLLALLWEVVVQAGHTAFPGLTKRRQRSLEGAENELLAVRIYSRLAYVYWFHSGRVPCGWAHLREMNLAERYPPTPELAQAYSEHAPVMTMVPWFSRGIAYAKRSLAIRQDLGDVWGQGQSMNFYGVVLYAASRYAECIEQCHAAVRLLERTGDRWEVNTANWNIGFALYRLGDLAGAVEMARHVHAAALAIGDQTAAGISLSAWARASRGKVPAELIRAQLAVDTDDAQTAQSVRLAEAVRLLGLGDADGALVHLEAATKIIKDAGLRQEYVAPIAPWMATARRMALEAAPSQHSRPRRHLLRKASRAAGHAQRVGRTYRNNLPHALRERAIVASLRGHGRVARHYLAKSDAVAATQGARYEIAQTALARAKIGFAFGWGDAGDPEKAEAEVAALLTPDDRGPESATTELSLADRFATLQAVGRRIASATSVGGVQSAVEDAALTLLRGEHCYVLLLDEDGRSTSASGERLDHLSTTLVQRAVEAGTPVITGDASGEAADSVVLSGHRSVLCTPILSAQSGDSSETTLPRAVACFYVTHARVGGLFSQEEIQLAEFIATLAGATLEHLAGTEARFRSLAQNSSDVITIIDGEGRIGYQSSSVARVFGLRPDELLRRSFKEWVHPDDVDDVMTVLAGAGASPGQAPAARQLVECRLRHGDGTWRYVETAVNDLRDDPSVNGIVLNSRDVSERHQLEEQIRERAMHDPLTGLANRGLFADRVAHALTRAERRAMPNAVVYLDLDGFKTINDTNGHATGDLVLQGVARRLLSCVRPQDTVARFGGDEFAIHLEGANETECVRVANRITAALGEPFDVECEDVQTGTSVGIALAIEGDTVDELVNRADAAMYAAKKRGGGTYEVFQPQMRPDVVDKLALKADLQRAIDRDQLELHYQPILQLSTGTVVGFEALLRWRHPERGMLPPQEFIPMAEQSGLIVPIGAWVLREACRQARHLFDSHPALEPLGMNVNVSPRQLQHPSFVDEVFRALDESGCGAHRLTLEITETTGVDDPEAAIDRLNELKALGVRLAIDDFGIGYSTLSYLRRFPVDQLKIDRSFVSGLGRNADDTAIVENVIALAHSLDLETVAEGVETVAQMEHLIRLGCEQAQGYNWRRPSVIDELEEWLATVLPVTCASGRENQ